MLYPHCDTISASSTIGAVARDVIGEQVRAQIQTNLDERTARVKSRSSQGKPAGKGAWHPYLDLYPERSAKSMFIRDWRNVMLFSIPYFIVVWNLPWETRDKIFLSVVFGVLVPVFQIVRWIGGREQERRDREYLARLRQERAEAEQNRPASSPPI